jgi:hypothetical protein
VLGNIKSFEKSFTHAEVVALAARTLKRFGGDRNKAGRYARSMENRYESAKWAQVVEVIATGGRHHATKKSSARLQREINEVLAKPSDSVRGAHAVKTVAMAPGTYAVVDDAPAWKAFTLYADGRVDFVDARDGHISAWNINTWGEGDRWIADRKKELAAGRLRKIADR